MSTEVVLSEPEREKFLVDGVPVVPTSSDEVADKSSMVFNLQTSGLALQIQTSVPSNLLIVELKAQLQFALNKLTETEQKLETAIRRIGFLEAQLHSDPGTLEALFDASL